MTPAFPKMKFGTLIVKQMRFSNRPNNNPK
jgi:hypothetical protein